MTCEEVRTYFQESDMALLTVGCLENHGSHNVLGVDTLVPEKLLSMIEEKVRIAAAPGIPYGVCDDMTGYSGSISIGEECMYMLLTRITDGLISHGAKKILFLNGHGGNIPTLNRVCVELSKKRRGRRPTQLVDHGRTAESGLGWRTRRWRRNRGNAGCGSKAGTYGSDPLSGVNQ